jgi:hypothetical protein
MRRANLPPRPGDWAWPRYEGPLRTVTGAYPTGSPCGHHFGLGQGEWWHAPGRDAGLALIGVLQLNTEGWLAYPNRRFALGYHVTAPEYATREEALRLAIASMLRVLKKRARCQLLYQGPPISAAQFARVGAWLRSLLDQPAKPPRALFIVQQAAAITRPANPPSQLTMSL